MPARNGRCAGAHVEGHQAGRMPSPPADRRSRRCARAAGVQQPQYAIEFDDCLLEFGDRVDRQLLGLGEVVPVFRALLLEPLEAVELEVTLLDLADVEAAPTVFLGVPNLSLRASIGIRAVAPLELREVPWRKWAALLRNRRNVGPGVVDPDLLSCAALREKHDVGLDASAVRREAATRKTQDGMKVTVLRHNLEHLTRLIFEEAIVREDYRCTAAVLEDREHVLDEVELLVARGDREVVPLRRLVRTLRPERGVREDNVEERGLGRRVVYRVTERDGRLDLVKIEVHQRQ